MQHKEGLLFNVQPFSLHDGEGIRSTVFLKGCNMRCFWCHNPESFLKHKELMFFQNKCIACDACNIACPQAKENKSARFTDACTLCFRCANACYADALQVVGQNMDAQTLFKDLIVHKDIFLKSKGGVTFSGGEPFLQHEFLYEILRLLKEHNIHTAVESALFVPFKTIAPLLPLIDTLYTDIKTMNQEKHKQGTGVDNALILDNIKKINALNKDMHIRVPIIPTLNDDEKSMEKIADFVQSLPNKVDIELLPFHNYCIGKYQALNKDYKAKDLKTPSNQTIKNLEKIFLDRDIAVQHT